MKFTGKVVVQRVATGSKSERETLMLRTATDRFVLRRKGASAFAVDEKLRKLEGQEVQLEGQAAGSTIIFTQVEPQKKPPSP